MTPDELKHWRRSVMKFPNQTEAAKALGYSRSRFTELENGRAGETLPVAVALACAAIAAGLRPWPEGTEHEELPLETAIRKTRGSTKTRRSTPKQKVARSRQQSTKKKTAAPGKKRPFQKRRTRSQVSREGKPPSGAR